MQTGYVKSFNYRIRDKLLNETLFTSVPSQAVIPGRAVEYNTNSPPSAQGFYQGLAAHAASPRQWGRAVRSFPLLQTTPNS